MESRPRRGDGAADGIAENSALRVFVGLRFAGAGWSLAAGNAADADAASGLLEGEPAGTVVLADSAYGTGALRARAPKATLSAFLP